METAGCSWAVCLTRARDVSGDDAQSGWVENFQRRSKNDHWGGLGQSLKATANEGAPAMLKRVADSWYIKQPIRRTMQTTPTSILYNALEMIPKSSQLSARVNMTELAVRVLPAEYAPQSVKDTGAANLQVYLVNSATSNMNTPWTTARVKRHMAQFTTTPENAESLTRNMNWNTAIKKLIGAHLVVRTVPNYCPEGLLHKVNGEWKPSAEFYCMTCAYAQHSGGRCKHATLVMHFVLGQDEADTEQYRKHNLVHLLGLNSSTAELPGRRKEKVHHMMRQTHRTREPSRKRSTSGQWEEDTGEDRPACSDRAESEDEEEEQEWWEVAKVVGRIVNKGKGNTYKVRWLNCGAEEDSWLKGTDLTGDLQQWADLMFDEDVEVAEIVGWKRGIDLNCDVGTLYEVTWRHKRAKKKGMKRLADKVATIRSFIHADNTKLKNSTHGLALLEQQQKALRRVTLEWCPRLSMGGVVDSRGQHSSGSEEPVCVHVCLPTEPAEEQEVQATQQAVPAAENVTRVWQLAIIVDSRVPTSAGNDGAACETFDLQSPDGRRLGWVALDEHPAARLPIDCRRAGEGEGFQLDDQCMACTDWLRSFWENTQEAQNEDKDSWTWSADEVRARTRLLHGQVAGEATVARTEDVNTPPWWETVQNLRWSDEMHKAWIALVLQGKKDDVPFAWDAGGVTQPYQPPAGSRKKTCNPRANKRAPQQASEEEEEVAMLKEMAAKLKKGSQVPNWSLPEACTHFPSAVKWLQAQVADTPVDVSQWNPVHMHQHLEVAWRDSKQTAAKANPETADKVEHMWELASEFPFNKCALSVQVWTLAMLEHFSTPTGALSDTVMKQLWGSIYKSFRWGGHNRCGRVTGRMAQQVGDSPPRWTCADCGKITNTTEGHDEPTVQCAGLMCYAKVSIECAKTRAKKWLRVPVGGKLDKTDTWNTMNMLVSGDGKQVHMCMTCVRQENEPDFELLTWETLPNRMRCAVCKDERPHDRVTRERELTKCAECGNMVHIAGHVTDTSTRCSIWLEEEELHKCTHCCGDDTSAQNGQTHANQQQKESAAQEPETTPQQHDPAETQQAPPSSEWQEAAMQIVGDNVPPRHWGPLKKALKTRFKDRYGIEWVKEKKDEILEYVREALRQRHDDAQGADEQVLLPVAARAAGSCCCCCQPQLPSGGRAP